jgi:hypothetical protein
MRGVGRGPLRQKWPNHIWGLAAEALSARNTLLLNELWTFPLRQGILATWRSEGSQGASWPDSYHVLVKATGSLGFGELDAADEG